MGEAHAVRVAFQGKPGAFSHKAVKLFAEDVRALHSLSTVSCGSFGEVFKAIAANQADFGVVPLENSSVGSIVANYDLLFEAPVKLVSEVYVPVHHNLLGLPGATVEDIKEIYSHPVALDQCKKFLASLPEVKAVTFWDTAASAFHVKEKGDKSLASISSDLAAKETGLAVLLEHVEDHSGNRTRFGVITLASGEANGRTPYLNDLQSRLRLKAYKLSCVAELKHESGSLAALLQGLADEGVNLTKIESRPIPETPWHYRFFFDIEVDQKQDRAVSGKLRDLTESNKILGRYPIWEESGRD
jgi:prephenate dehydratase